MPSTPTSADTQLFHLYRAIYSNPTPTPTTTTTTTQLFFLHPTLHSSSGTEEPESHEYDAEDENEPEGIQDLPEHSTDENEPEDTHDTLEHFTDDETLCSDTDDESGPEGSQDMLERLADAILGEGGKDDSDSEDYEARLDMLTRLAYAILVDDDEEFEDDVFENQITWTLDQSGHSAQFEEWAYMTGHRTLNYDADDEDESGTEDDYYGPENSLVLDLAGDGGV
jgi:hypothetical protein